MKAEIIHMTTMIKDQIQKVFELKLTEIQRFILMVTAAAALIWLLLTATAWIVPMPDEALWRPSSTMVFDRRGQLLEAYLSEDDMWRIQTPLSQVSPNLQRSLLGFEDRWFYWHHGINPIAIGRAFIQNLRSGRTVSGGSTITMQIARMIEPKRRTIQGKLWEMARAFQLELRYSKRQLLEIYFNIAPYGGNIEGVAAASWLYFGKEPSQLSLGESAMLIALPNAPSCRPDVSPAKARVARNRILTRLLVKGVISKEQYLEALREEVPDGRRNLPHIAQHFARNLWMNYPGQARIYSTMDGRIQSVAEDLLRMHLNSLRGEGITNGAIVVLDNQTHEVLAMVGSGDFNDRRHDGQVNGALAPRSPGSALKPFIYAMALQKGIISPAHYMEDVPTDFSGYTPENYDRTFSGVVSARTALEKSLNLPAVALEQALGERDLYYLMQQAGVTSLRSRENYGLSIAIGGCEINLLDLSALYSSLACNGSYIRPKMLLDEPEAAGIQLFDPGAAYIITDILTGLRRPDLPACWEFTSLPQVAWKTGTSYGHRDAWSIGYNPRYTVGVWLGNFSGEGARNLVGAEVAGPILFELMNNLCHGKQIRWFARPDSVAVREVCSLSGQVPGPNCSTTEEELYLPDRSPDAICQFHQSIQIDDQTGCRMPPHFSSDRKSHTKIYVQWPARVGSWLESSGNPIDRLPPPLPDWQELTPGTAPIIRSPSQDCKYRLREGVATEFQKICCEASAGSDVQKLYWFVDGRLLGSVKPGERLFYIPIVGRHRLICQDDLGRCAEFKLVIESSE